MANLTEATAQGNLAHKPNLKDLEMASDGEDEEDDEDIEDIDDDEDDMEEGESDIDDDMGAGKAKRAALFDSSEEESEQGGRVVEKGGVYKAPKLNAVAYEDSKDRKKRQKAEFERKRLGKTSLVEELKREMDDAPEELYMGGVAKKGKVSKFQDALERDEMDAFRRVNMTTKEKKALRNRNFDEMQDKLETLDDDFAAIQSIVRRSGSKGNDEAVESAERDAAGSKFAKSLKNFIDPSKKKKIDAEKAKRIKQEQMEKSKHREEKAARKLAAQREFQENKLKEVKEMNQDIARNINRDMLKAKGITRKRKKEDANPRVKKRRQYDKLVKKHKTKVQEFQDGKA